MNHRLLQYLTWISVFCVLSLTSCKKKEVNYILYYQKVNDIDSIYRMAGNPKLAAEEYKKLFSEYEPRNQELIKEYETYLMLADRYHIDFDGEESLNKLIPLIAPYGNYYKTKIKLFEKYGIDSLNLKEKVSNFKKNLNQTLIDSFTVAIIRDREKRHIDIPLQEKNVRKNARFLIWVFKNYGFPTPQKMGTMGHNDTFFAMTTFLTHMNETKEYYPYIKSKMLEYVKSGDCVPRDYTLMVDNVAFLDDEEGTYRFNPNVSTDSAKINRHRRSIGLPSLKHAAKIKKDYFAKPKEK